jgi:hypothetical protein
MLLSLREAALLLGRSPRTLRAQVARGEVKGVKQNNRWMIARAALPMSDSRLAEVQRRAEQVRAEVEAALPSRTGARKPRSIEDFAPFRVVREVLASLPPGSPAAPALRRAALALAAGVHRYRGPDKHAALAAARHRHPGFPRGSRLRIGPSRWGEVKQQHMHFRRPRREAYGIAR